MKVKSLLAYHLLALLVVAVWGVTFVCTKILIAAGLKPAEIFAIRFTLAYVGIWASAFIAEGKEGITRLPSCSVPPLSMRPYLFSSV